MRLRVSNLGPIREAELDLSKPLIVLVGPNNSGKTYLAWVAYSLARMNVAKLVPPSGLNTWAREVLQSRSQEVTRESLVKYRDEVLVWLAEALKQQVPEDFAAPKERFGQTHMALSPDAEDDAGLLDNQVNYGTTHAGFIFTFTPRRSGGPLSIGVHRSSTDGPKEMRLDEAEDSETDELAGGLAKLAAFVSTDSYLERSYVALPVERLAINLFARELAANRTELVDELLKQGEPGASPDLRDELRKRAGAYPRVIRDALQEAIRSSRQVETGPMRDLADELEQAVLEGAIDFTNQDDVEYTPSGADGISLRLHESASVVKSLVSLVLYLRYRARPGQRLVIDEPELNLHPDNQRRVARVLAKAINRGLKVMMSTHSDYIIRELNNLVMLGQGTDQAKTLGLELGYDAEHTLQPEQLGAYLVKGGDCRALPVTETGFEVETIEDEIHRLNRDSQLIYQRLFCE